MSKNHCDTLVVSIPPALFDLPVKIVRGNGANELVCYMKAGEEHMSVINHAEHIDKYVFVRCNDSYKKIEISNILWASADRSYSEIHLTDNTTIVLSFPLSVVEKSLPTIDFVRIHRSVLLNLKHVDRMCGNTLYVGKTNFTIGREYRERAPCGGWYLLVLETNRIADKYNKVVRYHANKHPFGIPQWPFRKTKFLP